MRAKRRVGLVLGALTLLVGLACDRRPRSDEQACPACECKCNCEPVAAPVQAPVAAPVQVVASDVSREVTDLMVSASRKMNFDDGAGCLIDLDRIDAIDPKLGAHQVAIRAQCEMLVGLCQEGKQRIARYYQEQTNMHPERALVTAEAIASMRCRGGDSSDRDRLMRAFFQLSDGAYMNKTTPETCKAALAEARRLIPLVKTRSPDDTQISGGAQALFHTAASCFARAGDCDSAWATYSELFPRVNAPQTPEAAAMMPQIIRESYDTSVLFCGAKVSGPAEAHPPPPPLKHPPPGPPGP